MQFDDVIKNRYSVRNYTQDKVEKAKLDKILEACVVAPTARNNQPQRIKVITSKKDLALIDECSPCRFGAPLALLVCYDKKGCWVNKHDGTINTGDIDCSIAITYMMLTAVRLGLGTLWVKHFDHAKAATLFNLDKDIVPVSFLMVGYAAQDSTPNPRHFESKAIDDLLIK